MAFVMNLASLMWISGRIIKIKVYKKKKKKKKNGPIICTVENEIPKYQTGYMQNSFLKSRDFSNLHFVGKMGQKNKY